MRSVPGGGPGPPLTAGASGHLRAPALAADVCGASPRQLHPPHLPHSFPLPSTQISSGCRTSTGNTTTWLPCVGSRAWPSCRTEPGVGAGRGGATSARAAGRRLPGRSPRLPVALPVPCTGGNRSARGRGRSGGGRGASRESRRSRTASTTSGAAARSGCRSPFVIAAPVDGPDSALPPAHAGYACVRCRGVSARIALRDTHSPGRECSTSLAGPCGTAQRARAGLWSGSVAASQSLAGHPLRTLLALCPHTAGCGEEI